MEEMVYTCYEMVRDCRADRPEGWRFLVVQYVPAMRRIVRHYGVKEGDPAETEVAMLASIARPDSPLFVSLDPAPERVFVAGFRQSVLERIPAPAAEFPVSLEAIAAAFEPLTLVEKQAAWLESMGYDAEESGTMLRMAPQTVAAIRARAAELLRGKTDAWRPTLLSENGRELGSEAAPAAEGCLPAKKFLDIIDGRTTWAGREELAQHTGACWHCIDHFCRLVEVVSLIRGIEPLSEIEAEPFYRALKLTAKPAGWKRWFATS
jgi:hypothetical protein